MANMSANQRAQLERVDLSVPTTGVRVRHRGYVIAFTAVVTLIGVALGYATVEAIDGWARAVVLGMIIVTVIGAMIALSPRRRA